MKKLIAALAVAWAGSAFAHCDTLDGPVVASARKALDTGNVNHALVWVRASDEQPVREAFAAARAARGSGDAGADRAFYEALVRVHRAGEGEAYTGLKPAGNTNAAIAAADESLRTGRMERVDGAVLKPARDGLRKSWRKAVEMRAKAKDPNDLEAGRAAATAYVEYVQYVERLHEAAATHAPHGESVARSH